MNDSKMGLTKRREFSANRKNAAINKLTPNSTNATYKLGDYVIGETIGVGTFGKVKVAYHQQSNDAVAVKFLCRRKIREQHVAGMIIQEILNHHDLHHPHIIRLYLTLSCPTHIIMVMEYVGGGDLFNYIVSKGRLSERESRRLFQQIISAVEFMHRHQIVHRDLKPENILLTQPSRNAKLADFGLSQYLEDGELLNTSCGSPNYAAPEVISGSLYGGPELDVWSAGVILYAMLSGSLPFSDQHLPSLFRKIKAGAFQMVDEIPSQVAPLIKHMLTVDPQKRATSADILKNRWFRTGLPAYLFAPVSRKFSVAAVDGLAIDQASQRLGIEEDQVLKAILAKEDSSEIRKEVEKIVAWISFETERKSFKHKRPLSARNPRKFPSWYLGIRSSNNPVQIMLRLYLVLKEMNFEWQTISPYNLIVRPKSTEETMDKIHIGLNLYQATYPSNAVYYILDFKLIGTEICSSLRSRSGSINSSARNSNRRSPSINEMLKNRAGSCERQRKSRETAQKFVSKQWQSSSEHMDASPLHLAGRLPVACRPSSIDFNVVSSPCVEIVVEPPEMSHSEILRCFDHCSTLIIKLLKEF